MGTDMPHMETIILNTCITMGHINCNNPLFLETNSTPSSPFIESIGITLRKLFRAQYFQMGSSAADILCLKNTT